MNNSEYDDWYEQQLKQEECEEEQSRLCKAIWGEKDDFFKAKELFEASGRDEIDRRLDELLRRPPIGMAPQSPEAMEWMTDEERRSMAWFDHEDYDTFMKRSAWYDGDGWVIPYYRQLCEEMHLASDEVLEDFAVDYKIRYAHIRKDFIRDEEPWVKATREERLVRVAGRIFSDAEAGSPRAANALGTFCENNEPRCLRETFGELGVTYDKEAAREWYRKSAAGGCVQGQRNYARVLMNGIGAEWEHLPIAERVARSAQDRKLALDLYFGLAERGDVKTQYRLACLFAEGARVDKDIHECAKWLRMAACGGYNKAASVVSEVGNDTSDERLFAELIIFWQKEHLKTIREEPDFTISYRLPVASKKDKSSVDKLLKGLPEGTVLPPSAGRSNVRTPNLNSANPSFAARLIILVRDRFGGDAPAVYKAAHVSRKTYSSIVSNELRPVAKDTAIAFSLAMRLSIVEAGELLESAGFSFSKFYLEDIIVKACIIAGIYDIERVNAILAAHGARTFRTE